MPDLKCALTQRLEDFWWFSSERARHDKYRAAVDVAKQSATADRMQTVWHLDSGGFIVVAADDGEPEGVPILTFGAHGELQPFDVEWYDRRDATNR
jgi:hypothetical protein